MSATDELRRMLDERGVEYETDDRNGLRETIWCDTAVFQLSPTAKMTMIVTPEQAIAATLGSDRESELQSALNKAAGNWAKADDRLRKALSFMRIWISEDAHIGESELSAAFEKAEGLRKLDAIESAITATLGSGTCAQCAKDMGAYADSLCDPLKERVNELLRCLKNDWHICASWDGLRKFWNIELTEEGVRLRDAANGTLTAEQVREAIMSADRWEKPMGNTGLTNTHLIIRDDGWRAIADELNATLGGGECKVVASSTDGLTTDEPRQWFKLSCGHAFKLDGLDAPVACPVCGKAVKR